MYRHFVMTGLGLLLVTGSAVLAWIARAVFASDPAMCQGGRGPLEVGGLAPTLFGAALLGALLLLLLGSRLARARGQRPAREAAQSASGHSFPRRRKSPCNL